MILSACDEQNNSDSSTDGSQVVSSETLSLNASYVNLDIKALNSVDAVAVEKTSSSFTSTSSGSLAISTELLSERFYDDSFALATALPADKPNQITSGPPDEMHITIYKIEFANSGNNAEGGFSGDLSIKAEHLELWSADGLSDSVIEQLRANVVGHVYSGQEELISALMSAGVKESDFDLLTFDEATLKSDYVFSDLANTNIPTPVVFDDEDGVSIIVKSGHVDLSELIAKASETEEGDAGAKFSVKPGVYNSLIVTFKHSSLMKGCLSADFSADSAHPGLHKYCTRSGKSLYDEGTVTGTDFENQEPQLMKVSLERSFVKGNDSEYKNRGYMPLDYAEKQFSLTFKLPANFEIAEGSSVDLSMVLDLNRMLRFYNQGDQISTNTSYEGANPSFPTLRPHFFTTIFEQSVYVFAGKPGRAYGYEMVTYGCDGISQTEACDGTPVSFWTTILTDQNGSPIVISSMPDDDRDFTVISNNWGDVFHDLYTNSQNRDCSKMKTKVTAQKPGVFDLIRKNSTDPTKVDYLYGIGCDFFGYMLGFDPKLDHYSVGENLPLFHFQLEHSQHREDNGASSNISGPVYSIRRL
ncbi:MAG: hypothetical protein AB8C84_11565 [Oligoflexales bacterium]